MNESEIRADERRKVALEIAEEIEFAAACSSSYRRTEALGDAAEIARKLAEPPEQEKERDKP
jgi:hypothetical protein